MASRDVIIFHLDNQRFAVNIERVERVIWIVEITPTPQYPDYILGLFNIEGEVLPVLNIRNLLHLPEREIDIHDQLLIYNLGERKMALWIDGIDRIYSCSKEEIAPITGDEKHAEAISGVLKVKEEIILIYDWEKLISKERIENLLEVPS